MYKDKIDTYFEENQTQMIESISRLVRIPSVRGEAKPNMPYGDEPVKALREAIKIAEELGFKTTNYGDIVAGIDFNENEKALDILAHLDVVPAPAEDWTVTQPFEPVVKNGRIYGRGSADDKGPAMAALYAMKAIKDMDIALSKNVRLILGTDEECGSSDLNHYYSKEAEAPMSFTPDSDFPVTNVEKGRLSTSITAKFPTPKDLPRINSLKCGVSVNVVPDKAYAVVEGFSKDELEGFAKTVAEKTKVSYFVTCEDNICTILAHGVAGHAAHPEVSNNALTAILELLKAIPFAESDCFTAVKNLSDLFPHRDYFGAAAGVKMADPISGDLTISLNMIELDSNSISATFDGRLALNANEDNVNKILAQKCSEKGLTFIDKPIDPPHHVSGDSNFVKTLNKCYEEYTGNKGGCLAIGGGTYVHHLKNGVAFGACMPEVECNMHGADESAVIADLVTAAKIYTQAIIDLCNAY